MLPQVTWNRKEWTGAGLVEQDVLSHPVETTAANAVTDQVMACSTISNPMVDPARNIVRAASLCYNLSVDDAAWMLEALAEAELALSHDDVPIGAIVVLGDQVIGRGHNRREANVDPTAHAELLAIREAARTLGGWRLSGTTVYCTLEPCPMCAGAMVQARVSRLVYGADDPKAGAAGSVVELLRDPRFNHQVMVSRGVMATECEKLLQRFFSRLRQ